MRTEQAAWRLTFSAVPVVEWRHDRPLEAVMEEVRDIPASSPRPRLTVGAFAVATTVALAGLVAWPTGAEGRRLLLGLGLLPVLLQATAVVRAAFPLATASAVVLLADYAVAVVISLGARGAVAVVLGSGLLLAAALAAWSVDLARTGAEPAHLVRRRVGTLAALVLGSAAFSDAVVVSAAQLEDR
jgi:hypothetical protein